MTHRDRIRSRSRSRGSSRTAAARAAGTGVAESRATPSPRWINRAPASPRALAAVPFALLVAAYLGGSAMRQTANPGDKLMPSPSAMAKTWSEMALSEDTRTGEVLFWTDTSASLVRLATGLSIATSLALVPGQLLGMQP